MKERPLNVEIEKDELVIRIGIGTLAFAANECQVHGFLDEEGDQVFKVTDNDEFSKSVVSVLLEEEEDGTTIVHKMFDGSFLRVVENGMDGIDERRQR